MLTCDVNVNRADTKSGRTTEWVANLSLAKRVIEKQEFEYFNCIFFLSVSVPVAHKQSAKGTGRHGDKYSAAHCPCRVHKLT